MPAKFPRAGRIVSESEEDTEVDDAPSRGHSFWEQATADVLPGVTRLSTPVLRLPLVAPSTLAEGTNPPRAPKRHSTRDETAPLD